MQGKVERYHRSMMNEVLLQHYNMPDELERGIARFVEHYNNERFHESLSNLTPADVYVGRATEIETRWEKIKRQTMQRRRKHNRDHVHSTSIKLELPKSLS
jgi:hypothetical protein